MDQIASGALSAPARLDLPRRAALLDTRLEEAIGRLTRVASAALRAPVALVDVVRENRQFVHGFIGRSDPWESLRETPLSHSPFLDAVASGGPLLIEDAREHPLMRDSLAVRDRGAIAYAGVPLLTSEGYSLGSFCVIDSRPRRWTEGEIGMLRDLAATAATEVELRLEAEGRRRAEEALRRREQSFRRTFEGSPLPMWIFDPETLAFLDVNEAAIRHYGYAREEFLSMTLRDIRPAEDWPRLLEATATPWADPGLSFRARSRHLRKDRSLIEVEIHAQDTLYRDRPARLVLIHDVTEQRREERMLRLLADSGAALASSLDYGTTLTNVARLVVPGLADHCAIDVIEDGGEVRRVEVAFASPEREDLADRLKERFAPRPGSPQPAAEVMRTGRSLLVAEMSEEWMREHASDEEHLEIVRALKIRSLIAVPLIARGQTLGAMTLTTGGSGRGLEPRDLRIAEVLAERAALAIDNARLYQAAQQAVHARDEILAIVSAELRGPLNATRAVLELLLEGRSPEAWRPADRKQLESIQGSTAQMARLVHDLEDITQLESGHLRIYPERLEPGPLVAMTVKIFCPLAEAASLRLECDVSSDLPALRADRGRIQQVLCILADKAISVSPAGGKVTVAAQATREEVYFSVSPDPGIPEEQLSALLNEVGHGQGRGADLAIARGIVGAHGGRIWVESRPGEGPGVHFAIPVDTKRGEAPAEEWDPTREPVASVPGIAERLRTRRCTRVRESIRREGGEPCEREAELLRPMSIQADPPTFCDVFRSRIAHAVHLGQCQPGQRLPSIREIHRTLKVPLSTIVKAYGQLESEGLVERRERSGIYLAPQDRPGGELLSETAQWMAEVLTDAYEQQVKLPHLSELMHRWTAGIRLRCACVESSQDHLTALCSEMRQHFGLDAEAVSASDLPGSALGTPITLDMLPASVRSADLIVTTALHATTARAVAEALHRPLVIMTVNPEAIAAAERVLREQDLTVVCTDPRFGERVSAITAGRYPHQVRVVLAENQDALDRLDPSTPVLLTRAAHERLKQTHLRLLVPLSPSFSLSSVRSLAHVIIRLNMQGARQ